MDDRRGRTDETAFGDALIRRLRDRFAPGRHAALRSGQVVPRRTLPRWAFSLLLARATACRCGTTPNASTRETAPIRSRPATTPQRLRAASPTARRRSGVRGARATKTRWHYSSQGRSAAGERHRARIQTRRSRKSARGSREPSSAGSNTPAAYVLPVTALERGRRRRWRSEQLVDAGRPHATRARATRRSGSACRSPRCRRLEPERPAGRRAARSVRAAAAAARSRTAAARRSSPARRATPRTRAPAERRAELDDRRFGAHRALGRAARRTPVRLHAADRIGRRLPRAARRGRGDGGRARHAGAHRGLSAAVRSAHQRHQGDARSRRDRGERPPGPQLARSGGDHDDALRRSASRAAGDGEVPARRQAYRHRRRQPHRRRRGARRPTARSCAGRICCAAWSAFWQNHPSLSYLFSGLFIGPDEPGAARRRSAARLALRARDRVRRSADARHGSVSPWLVDRIFRNLLIDVTGNTHRTEICIDKLYSPDGPTGRLGWSSSARSRCRRMREMSLAQQLLLRAFIARFWESRTARARALGHGAARPVHAAALRVGRLHRRARDLRDARLRVRSGWFRPHWEFRFPLYGAVQYDGVKLELRGALEPWNVMGEEGTRGGTVRYVDGSVERLEVKIAGYTAGRHHVVRQRTARAAAPRPRSTRRSAASVTAPGAAARAAPDASRPTPRCSARSGTSCDRRSLGGCTYHVSHPGGRNYTTFPVNAYEAEGRRLARFEPFGFTPGNVRAAAARRPARVPAHARPAATG